MHALVVSIGGRASGRTSRMPWIRGARIAVFQRAHRFRRPAAGPIFFPSRDTVRHDVFGVVESVIDCRFVIHQLSA